MLIGQKIKTCRLEAGLSQEDLAEQLDTSRQTISSWENGKTYPGIQSIAALGALFQISIESLVKEDVKMMKETLNDKTKSKKISRNKDRSVMNRLTALRFFLAFAGALTAYPVHTYFGGHWFLIPLLMLGNAAAITVPIELYRKKYHLRKYEDIVAFFDEKYEN